MLLARRVTKGNWFLEKRLQSVLKNQNRQKSFLSFDEVKTLGIVFEATNPEQFEIVKNYVLALKQKGKRVHGLGFYDNKLIPDNVYYSKTDFDLLLNIGYIFSFLKTLIM